MPGRPAPQYGRLSAAVLGAAGDVSEDIGRLAFGPRLGKSMNFQRLIAASASAEASVVNFVLHWLSILDTRYRQNTGSGSVSLELTRFGAYLNTWQRRYHDAIVQEWYGGREALIEDGIAGAIRFKEGLGRHGNFDETK